MPQTPNNKPEDLETRTFKFAENCRDIIKQFPRTISNIEYAKQLARSSGSVAANYIEANESLSKKDFVMRLRISRKEVKESRMWLRLAEVNEAQETLRQQLVGESTELLKIFSSIIDKATS